MSNIKLVHSGGNSVSLTTPDSNPAANRTFKLPGADGSAGQFLKTDGSGALSFAGAGKVVGLSIVNSTTNEQNTSGDQTWTLVGPQLTHTAASASNKLVFLHNHHMMTENLTWSMGLWRDGTSGTLLYRMETYDQSAIWQATQGIGSVVADAPDTSSHTYQFAIWRNGGSDGKIRYSPNSNSTGSQIIMLEIQP
mgnify:CR=1 FL=1